MNKSRFGLPSLKLIGLAVVAGMIAGAGGVYMKSQGSGNGSDEIAAATGECEADTAQIDAIKPFIKGQVAALIPATPVRKLKSVFFNGPDGKPMGLGDLEGKIVLVNLWATWCAPCKAEMPALDNLQAQEGSDGAFTVAAINIDSGDSDEKPKSFLNEIDAQNLTFYRDGTMGVFNSLKKEGLVIGLPATLLLNKNGCLLATMNGPAAWDSDDALALVSALKDS